MSDLAKYYEESLYPLQNGVLNIVQRSKTPFFLTGGTALSRGYLHHRFSDDLDLFVVNDPSYLDHVHVLLQDMVAAEKEGLFLLDRQTLQRSKDYTQFFVVDQKLSEVTLKIDLVNDVAAYYGQVGFDPVLGRIDNLRNILSNKITALFRSEPKDLFDIFAIAKQHRFGWKSILLEAKSKEAGAQPEVIYDLLRSFPSRYLRSIKWIRPLNIEQFETEIKILAEELLFGQDNTLSGNQHYSW
jgi:hypothetical protein